MDFVRYADSSAHLVNAVLPDAAAVRALLKTRVWLHDQCTDRDALVLRKFQRELFPVFVASGSGEVAAVTALLNELLLQHPDAVPAHERAQQVDAVGRPQLGT